MYGAVKEIHKISHQEATMTVATGHGQDAKIDSLLFIIHYIYT